MKESSGSKAVKKNDSGGVKDLVKGVPVEEAKKWAVSALSRATSSDELVFGKFVEYLHSTPRGPAIKDDVPEKVRGEIAEELMREIGIGGTLELETQFLLFVSSGKDKGPLAVRFCRQIMEEYGCQTAGEKALAEIIAGSFVRFLDVSQKLSSATGKWGPDVGVNGYLSALSKELDRSIRAYISALGALRQMKSPMLELNIKANTAFIAKNQQVNAAGSSKEVKPDENIKPK